MKYAAINVYRLKQINIEQAKTGNKIVLKKIFK